MRDPVISVHGYTFEKQVITNWLVGLGNNFCPCSGKDMTIHDLVYARNFKEEINQWRAENGLPSDCMKRDKIIGMTLTIGGKEEAEGLANCEDDHSTLLDKEDKEEDIVPPESKKKEDQNNHDISSANKAAGMSGHRGEKKMTRPPLLRLLRQKVFPVVQPRVSSS